MTSKTASLMSQFKEFASEGDLALFERNWSEHRSLAWGKLDEKGLVGFKAHQVWNQDENLTRMYIFEYESPEAGLKPAFPFGKELETAPSLEASR